MTRRCSIKSGIALVGELQVHAEPDGIDGHIHAIGNSVAAAAQYEALRTTAEVDVRVKKRVKRQGRVEEMGEVAIQFGSLEELNGLIEKLRG